MSAAMRELLLELADYFDDRMDINDDGGPNAAMTWHRRITEVVEAEDATTNGGTDVLVG